jgi:hypothetical protein
METNLWKDAFDVGDEETRLANSAVAHDGYLHVFACGWTYGLLVHGGGAEALAQQYFRML